MQFKAAGGAAATGPLYYWSYIYYLSKYYELLDTVLALGKGSVPRHLTLHTFHHALVLIMAWLWLEQRQSLQWIGLLFNTGVFPRTARISVFLQGVMESAHTAEWAGVHVIMYYFYSRVALGIRVWWCVETQTDSCHVETQKGSCRFALLIHGPFG